MGLTVTGGEGGIRAFLDDLAAMSRLVADAATTVTEAANAAVFGRMEIGACGGLDLGRQNGALGDLLTGLAAPGSAAHHTADELHKLAKTLTWVCQNYTEADTGVLGFVDTVADAALSLPVAGLKSGYRYLITQDPISSFQQLLTADPDLVDVASMVYGGPLLADAGSLAMDDGRAEVGYAGRDWSPAAVTPPRGVADLIAELALRNHGDSGEISVSFVYGQDGTRRAIVDIPGTKSWTPLNTSDITSLDTNARSINGAPTSYEAGVLEAMRQAGVTTAEPVMLVGHSEGGMIAVNTARDALAQGRFNVTHVVTAGAPIGRIVGDLPADVSVLALEGRHDVVPHLDSRANPDTPNITTVTGGKDYGSIGGNHSLDQNYESIATAVDASHNASIHGFLAGAYDFLHQPVMTTDEYVVSRRY